MGTWLVQTKELGVVTIGADSKLAAIAKVQGRATVEDAEERTERYFTDVQIAESRRDLARKKMANGEWPSLGDALTAMEPLKPTEEGEGRAPCSTCGGMGQIRDADASEAQWERFKAGMLR